MFLAFTAAALIAGALVQLGALSVEVGVLTMALQGTAAIALLATLAAIWSALVARRLRR